MCAQSCARTHWREATPCDPAVSQPRSEQAGKSFIGYQSRFPLAASMARKRSCQQSVFNIKLLEGADALSSSTSLLAKALRARRHRGEATPQGPGVGARGTARRGWHGCAGRAGKELGRAGRFCRSSPRPTSLHGTGLSTGLAAGFRSYFSPRCILVCWGFFLVVLWGPRSWTLCSWWVPSHSDTVWFCALGLSGGT